MRKESKGVKVIFRRQKAIDQLLFLNPKYNENKAPIGIMTTLTIGANTWGLPFALVIAIRLYK
jgi:hypothetical protein